METSVNLTHLNMGSQDEFFIYIYSTNWREDRDEVAPRLNIAEEPLSLVRGKSSSVSKTAYLHDDGTFDDG